jgi:SAM-dependent methyltransferase
MGYIFDFKDARAYDAWLNRDENRALLDLESRLLFDLLKPMRGETVVGIGCGTGTGLAPMLEWGLQVTGVDPSPYMLDLVSEKFGDRVDLYRGHGEDLPFDDNSFSYACLITVLEFVDDPEKVLAEACRVAKDRVFIGFLNRYAIKGVQRRVEGIFTPSIFNRARFFSIWEIKRALRAVVGNVPVHWRTVCQLPGTPGRIGMRIEQSQLAQRCPFGAYAGVVASLVPLFRTRPLAMPYQAKHRPGTVAG